MYLTGFMADKSDKTIMEFDGAAGITSNNAHLTVVAIATDPSPPSSPAIVNEENSLILSSIQATRMQVALNVVVQVLLPLCHGVARGWNGIRGMRVLRMLGNVRASRQMLTNLMAFAANTISLSLSSVQVVHKIDPLLKMIKLRRSSAPSVGATVATGSSASSATSTTIKSKIVYDLDIDDDGIIGGNDRAGGPEKCVMINVLAEPPPGSPIRADVIFIHGLHGSLVNTWKQGQWNSEGRRVNFQRPPKPPIRPPKRPRHSRSHTFEPPPHRSKKAKICPTGLRLNINAAATLTLANSSTCSSRSNSSIDASSPFDDGIGDLMTPPPTPPTGMDDCDIDYAYDCATVNGNADDDNNEDVIEYLTDMENNFPTFRLRRDDERVPEEENGGDDDDDDDGEFTVTPGDDLPMANDDDSAATQSTSTSSSNSEYSRCWPGDWLPQDCPGVRVIAVNYTTDPYLWRPMWIRKRNRTSLVERSREMQKMLTDLGVGVGHPIVWVGHSKGGIFIKQIIVDAWESGKAALAPLWRSSRGCLFYSVPHRGSPLADFNLPFVRQSIELVEIKKNCPGVLELHRRFVALYRSGLLKIQIFSFVETALTLMSVLYLRIVGIDSADPGIGEVCGVHLDHRQICKPRNRECILYTKLTRMINKVT